MVRCPLFDTHQLNIGDSIELIIEGKIIPFTVMGKGQSPDFAYALRTAQDFYPSPESFGIAYVPYDVMTSLLNQKIRLMKLLLPYRKTQAMKMSKAA